MGWYWKLVRPLIFLRLNYGIGDSLGLDGRPRPINIAHGKKVIQWERTESWVKDQILNKIIPVDSGEGWQEETHRIT